MNKKQKGVAIVEFALVLPVLLVLTFIATEFGRAIWQYNTLTKAVRDSARYLSLQTPGDPLAIARARNLTVYGRPVLDADLDGTEVPLAPGLSAAKVPAPTWQTAGSAPVINTVTIRISGYTFQSMFVGAFGLPFGDLLFADISATMRSYL
jgi:hypothetical protein